MTALFAFGDDKNNTGSGDEVWAGHMYYQKQWYFLLVWIFQSRLDIADIEYLVLVSAHP